MKNRVEQIKLAAWVAVAGNALLSVAKLVLGFVSGSLAVVGDGIDSATDIVTSALTLFTARVIDKPPDKEHPYGHGRAETLATAILAFVIFFAGAQLFLSTIHKIVENETTQLPTAVAVYVTLFSIAGKCFLAFWQMKIGKRIKSSMLIANGKNMQNDILMSCTVLAGLVFTYWLNLTLVDRIVALLLSFWIMRGAVGILLETQAELMDSSDDESIYQRIFEAVSQVPEASNPHRARVRKIATKYLVALDIEVDGAMTVCQAHKVAVSVEEKIKQKIEDIYDVRIHIEPTGNVEKGECFGVAENS